MVLQHALCQRVGRPVDFNDAVGVSPHGVQLASFLRQSFACFENAAAQMLGFGLAISSTHAAHAPVYSQTFA